MIAGSCLSRRERSSAAGRRRPGKGCDLFGERASLTRSAAADSTSPSRERRGREAFTFLTALAARRERITYADFAFSLGLGSPRQLGWLLTPLLRWCEAGGHPPLPIIVVRRADGLPSGGYDPDTIAAETGRVFAYHWAALAAPRPSDLAPFSLPPLPHGIRRATHLDHAS